MAEITLDFALAFTYDTRACAEVRSFKPKCCGSYDGLKPRTEEGY